MNSSVRIGLFGLGCVGRGLYDILSHTAAHMQIDRICVRRRDRHRDTGNRITDNPADILDDPDIDVVVELIDDHRAAYSIATEALRRGKSVVSANKRMLAGNLDALLRLQQEQPSPLLYEAACCASIPIIRTLEHYYHGAINGVEGIVNGTTNYILTRMTHDGLAFDEALRLAQQHGFAESDPSMDIEAFDAKFKLCLLAAHAFGVLLPVDKVFNYGIATISQEDIAFARTQNCTIKLLARAVRQGDRLSAVVLPSLIPASHPLSRVDNEFNGVLVHAPYSDAQFFYGRGAGGHPTASAVLADIAAAASRYRYGYSKLRTTARPDFTNSTAVDVYCRYGDTNIPDELSFDSIDRRFSSSTHNYVVGRVQLDALAQCEAVRREDVFVGMVQESKN